MRKRLTALVLAAVVHFHKPDRTALAVLGTIVALLGILAAVAIGQGETTGTNTACATASTPNHTVGVDSTPVDTITGDTATSCTTATYTIPTSTTSTTVTGPTTTVTVTSTPTSTSSTTPTTTTSTTPTTTSTTTTTTTTGSTGSPVSTASPAITDTTDSGRYQYADLLTATNGTWTVNGTATVCGASTGMVCAYQWQRSSNGGSTWSNITTGDCLVLCQAKYRVQEADVGDELRVIVTAGNAAGSTDANASATAAAVAPTCNYTVSTASALNSDYTAASADQTICLASGVYSWSPTTTAGGSNVLIQPAAGASVTMNMAEANHAGNFILAGANDAMTVSGAEIQNSANITIYDTDQLGLIVIMDDGLNNSNLVADANAWTNTSQCSTEARVYVDFNTTKSNDTDGILISNNYFDGGCTEDILLSAGVGTQMIGNDFTGEDNKLNENIHSDTIQFYDTGHDVVQDNWFHDQIDVPSCGPAEWDGDSSLTIENNVISHTGGVTGTDGCAGESGPALYYDGLGSAANGSTVSHNVIEPGFHENGSSTGGDIAVGGKTSEGAGAGTKILNNTYAFISNGNGGLDATFAATYNLCTLSCTTTGDTGGGAGDATGSPTWVGGSAPSSFVGFALAAGSKGVGAASDGTNIGVELPTGYSYPR